MQQMSEWSSFHIYLGEYFDRSDWLIREALPSVAGSNGWFYLYFTDELGPHIRFRVKSSNIDVNDVEDQLNQFVAEAPEKEKNITGALVSIAGIVKPSPAGRVGVRLVEYRPDLAKYRTEGIAVLAEESFINSTRLATSILAADYSGGLSKKSIAPQLAFELTRHLPDASGVDFLEKYAEFALENAQASSLKNNFLDAAERARERSLPVLIDRLKMPGDICANLDAWSASIDELLKAAGNESTMDELNFQKLLLMDAMHLNNNRLGFSFVDEAYISLLVRAQINGNIDG